MQHIAFYVALFLEHDVSFASFFDVHVIVFLAAAMPYIHIPIHVLWKRFINAKVLR